MNYKRNNNKALYGILLITVSILMFLSAFNLLPPGLITQAIGYTLIVYGIYALLSRDFYASLFSIAFGLKISPIILQKVLDFNQIGWFTLLFISFLLATGLETLFGKKYSWKKKFTNGKFTGAEFSKNDAEDLSGEYINASVNMGDSSRYVKSNNLKEANLSSSLGSLSVYFIGSALENDVNINVNCKLGSIDLYFPRDWHVVNNVSVTLGDVDLRQNAPNEGYTVYLNGNVSLGSVDVHFN